MQVANLLIKKSIYLKAMNDGNNTRRLVLDMLDCAATFASAPDCISGADLVPRQLDGSALNGIGKYQLSGHCDAQGLFVQAVWGKVGETEPWRGQPAEIRPLFAPTIRFCKAFVTESQPYKVSNVNLTDTATPCYSVAGGASTYWSGTYTCPAGFLTLSGGMDCGTIATQAVSTPSADLTSWTGTCCRRNTEVKVPVMTVTCILED
jgi:hypothetical protein